MPVRCTGAQVWLSFQGAQVVRRQQLGRDINSPALWSGAERCILSAAVAQKRGDGP